MDMHKPIRIIQDTMINKLMLWITWNIFCRFLLSARWSHISEESWSVNIYADFSNKRVHISINSSILFEKEFLERLALLGYLTSFL
jgi:hypothetical protein